MVFSLAYRDHNSEIAEGSLPSPSVTVSCRDVVSRNEDMRQEHTGSNTKNAGGSMLMVKDIVSSEAISYTGSSDCAVDGFVVFTRKKQCEVGKATSPLNPKQSNITRPL